MVMIDQNKVGNQQSNKKCHFNYVKIYNGLKTEQRIRLGNNEIKQIYFNDKKSMSLLKSQHYPKNVDQCLRQKLFNCIKQNDESKKIKIMHKLQLKEYKQYQQRESQLLGGGGCVSSKTQPIEKSDKVREVDKNLTQMELVKLKNFKVSKGFKENYEKYIKDQEQKKFTIENEYQIAEMHKIFEECIEGNRLYISTQVDSYRTFLFDIFDTLLQYMASGVENDQAITSDITSLSKCILLFKESLSQRAKTHQCLDLIFMTSFLQNLNEQRVGIDERNKSQLEKIAKLVMIIISIGINIGSAVVGVANIAFSIKNIILNSADLIDQVKKLAIAASDTYEKVSNIKDQAGRFLVNKENTVKYLVSLWAKKAELITTKESFEVEDEIEFYIDEYFELTKSKSSSNLILYIMTQINYLMESAGLANHQNTEHKQKTAKKFVNKLSLQKEKISDFISSLQQKSLQKANYYYENFKVFFKFTVLDPTFRFLSNQILLKYNIVFQEQETTQEQKDDYWIHLCYSYVTEKEESVRIVFQKDSDFVNRVNQMIQEKLTETSNKIIQKQKTRNEDFKRNDISDKEIIENESQITDENQFLERISLNLIEKWEQEARQRLDQDIALKDDALLEVQDLYIDQNITYLHGNPIFQKQDDKNNNNNDVNNPKNEKQISENNDAIQLIFENFINGSLKKEVVNGDQVREGKCQILGVLAEGGTGKSMLIKRIETIITKEKNAMSNKYQSIKNVIPFIIKCNSLNQKNPSLEEYLMAQKLGTQQIEIIKKSEKCKLILLDGYDEYSGDFFRIYPKLKLSEWKNTLVIVTSRKEKLSDNDAQLYFSADDESGRRNEQSYTIVQLNEFQRKDINTYCKKYFTKYRTNNQNKVNKGQLENDLKMMEQCLNNDQLESLLFLPINLYLFTRMLVTKSEFEVKELITNISDQIQIQEIFFQEQFNRESIDFFSSTSHNQANKELKTSISSAYFEYFQQIAMQMFLNKGKVSNFLQLEREQINFSLQQKVINILSADQKDRLVNKIRNYVNSKIITKIKESDQQEKQGGGRECQLIEFKHKSLFEYFVARAMKFDFDIHKENIYNIDISILKNFNINTKMIMNAGQNQSEQQILMKLFKLLQTQIDSPEFRENYNNEDISKTNRYIQYLKRSTIAHITDISQIDVGSSNLISALFISKFGYPLLTLKMCSFSRAYFLFCKSKSLNFDKCNLSDGYLQNSYLSNFETSNTKNAMFESFDQTFDSMNAYQFNSIIFHHNELISISKTGFINRFQIQDNTHSLLQQTKITCSSLTQIHLINQKFIVSSTLSLFEIDPISFEVEQTYRFISKIQGISSCKDSINFVVTLENTFTYFGNIQSGFKQFLIESKNAILSKKYLVTCSEESLTIYNVEENFKVLKVITSSYEYGQFDKLGKRLIIMNKSSISIISVDNNFEVVKTIHENVDIIKSSLVSEDNKYLITADPDNTYKIWDLENDLELKHSFKGHSEKLLSIAFSENNKYLATTSEDLTCRIWSIEKEIQLKQKISSHTDAINCVAYSHDAQYLATASSDSTCKIWSLSNNMQLIHVISIDSKKIKAVAFSRDGKYLATGSDDNICNIWNVKHHFQIVATLEGHTSQILSVIFSPDSQLLATASYDKTCKVWNPQKNFELISTLQDHVRPIQQVTFSPDGRLLATGSFDGYCKIYDIRKGFEKINSFEYDNWVYSIAFSHDGRFFAAAGYNGFCRIWNPQKDFELIKTIKAHSQFVHSIEFSNDGKYLATASEDMACKIWNVEKDFDLINTINVHTNTIHSLAFSTDGKTIATGSADKTFKIWNLQRGFESIQSIQGHISQIKRVKFSPDCKYIATCSSDKTMKIWNAEKGFILINTIQLFTDRLTNEILSIAFSPDSKFLAIGTEFNICKIWNLKKDFELVKSFEPHYVKISDMCFSPNGKYFATCSYETSCRVWNAEKDFSLVNEYGHENFVIAILFSPDNKILASASNDGIIFIISTENKFSLLHTLDLSEFGFDSLKSIAFSPDNKYFVSSQANNFKIWNAKKNFQILKTVECQNKIDSVLFSPDGKYLASGSVDQTCKMWNVAKSFQLDYTISGHTDSINSLAFSADGKYIITASKDQTCKIWNLSKGFYLIGIIQKQTDQIKQVSTYLKEKFHLNSHNQDDFIIGQNKIQSISFTNTEFFDEIYII